MKCVNCGKKFDYEKYYGICPKCGSMNWKEGGKEASGNSQDAQTSGAGSSAFFIVSLAVFLAAAFGGSIFGTMHERREEERLWEENLASEAELREHSMGEVFSFQGMSLTVTDAQVLQEEWEEDENSGEDGGRKLVAVKISGESNGKWETENQLSEAYIRYHDFCYWQIENDMFEGKYGGRYPIHLFDRYELCQSRKSEGWLVFSMDREEEEFTLCLEEREDTNLAIIRAIHSIEIHLEEGEVNE